MSGSPLALDCVIFGGGAAGLFTLSRLIDAGFAALVLEREALGAGQSRCAQGIIHGGVKYSLAGLAGADAKAIGDMPERWRRMLDGREAPELPRSALRANHGWLWRADGFAGRLGMLGARLALRTKPTSAAVEERPEPLRGVRGEVLRLPEPIVDPVAVLAALAERHAGLVARHDDSTLEVLGVGDRVRLRASIDTHSGPAQVEIDSARVILAAGAGNESLRGRFGCEPGRTQRRPLHQVLVRSPSLPWLDGHCVSGDSTRVTITSARDDAGRVVWHCGGELAEGGVSLDRRAQVRRAAAELREVLPDAPLDGAEFAAYRVDRAEPLEGGRRPDDARVIEEGPVLSLWPTKLALAPRAADLVLERMRRGSRAPSAIGARVGSRSGASVDSTAGRRADPLPLGIRPDPPAPAPPPWHDALEWTVAP